MTLWLSLQARAVGDAGEVCDPGVSATGAPAAGGRGGSSGLVAGPGVTPVGNPLAAESRSSAGSSVGPCGVGSPSHGLPSSAGCSPGSFLSVRLLMLDGSATLGQPSVYGVYSDPNHVRSKTPRRVKDGQHGGRPAD